MILGGDYNKSNESLNVNENNVASSPNLEDMHRKEALPIGCRSSHGNECNLLDPKGVFLIFVFI